MESAWDQRVTSVGNMKQGGVSVRMVSHWCGKYETGWGKCGKKKGRVRMKSVRVVTERRCIGLFTIHI